jgi:hypothetical protein
MREVVMEVCRVEATVEAAEGVQAREGGRVGAVGARAREPAAATAAAVAVGILKAAGTAGIRARAARRAGREAEDAVTVGVVEAVTVCWARRGPAAPPVCGGRRGRQTPLRRPRTSQRVRAGTPALGMPRAGVVQGPSYLRAANSSPSVARLLGLAALAATAAPTLCVCWWRGRLFVGMCASWAW